MPTPCHFSTFQQSQTVVLTRVLFHSSEHQLEEKDRTRLAVQLGVEKSQMVDRALYMSVPIIMVCLLLTAAVEKKSLSHAMPTHSPFSQAMWNPFEKVRSVMLQVEWAFFSRFLTTIELVSGSLRYVPVYRILV